MIPDAMMRKYFERTVGKLYKILPLKECEEETLKEYLDYDIQAEVVAIRDYNKALNEISDPNIVKIIERIILDEELHLKIFKELYAKYVKTPE